MTYDYAEKNMGCKYRTSSAVTRVLEKEESAIVLDDDCVPSDDFFWFCQEMLEKYRDDPQVMSIGGLNTLRKQESKEAYFFSKFVNVWGWATWKRAWRLMDLELTSWSRLRKSGALKPNFDFFSYRCYLRIADHAASGTYDSWAVPWQYSVYANHGLGILPSVNLVRNIGMGRADALHTTGESDRYDFSVERLDREACRKKLEIRADDRYEREHLKDDLGLKTELHYIRYKIGRILPKTIELLSGKKQGQG